jgi:D-glycero-beta-D-manno-heptose-7-phosphate kinase
VDKEEARLLGVVDRFAGRRVAVWGDFILDEYLYGRTRRISREAPVLIISYERAEFSLGGAGNSVLNLEALGASPLPVGVVGQDEPGRKIIDFLRGRSIPTRWLVRTGAHQTPIKMRVLAGEENTRKQQVLRIDKESAVPGSDGLKRKLHAALIEASSRCDALIVSDYNYMTVTPDVLAGVAQFFRKRALPLTLDSRFRLLQFKGMTAATPNEPEVEEALKFGLGDNPAALRKAGDALLRRLQSPALLITRGSRGLALFEKGRAPFLLPVHGSTDIVDVTGAGDTVISVFTLALACGAGFKDAARLANIAGGIVVMKKGTATLTAQELRHAISS